MRKLSAVLALVAVITFLVLTTGNTAGVETTKTFDMDGGNSDVTVTLIDGCAVNATTIYGYTLDAPKRGCVEPEQLARDIWELQNKLTR